MAKLFSRRQKAGGDKRVSTFQLVKLSINYNEFPIQPKRLDNRRDKIVL